MKFLLRFISISILFISCSGSENENFSEKNQVISKHIDVPAKAIDSITSNNIVPDSITPPSVDDPGSGEFYFRITKGEKGYGYEILQKQDDHVVIRQPNIPAVQGNREFETLQQAQETAKLVVYKLNHGISPPAVSIDELRKFGVF